MQTFIGLIILNLFIFLQANAQGIVFTKNADNVHFDEIIFNVDGSVSKTINPINDSPYNHLNFNVFSSGENKDKKYSLSNAEARDFIQNSDIKYSYLIPDVDTISYLLHAYHCLSWLPFNAIKAYHTVALAYSMHLSSMDYKSTVVSESTVIAFNERGEEIYSELTDKFVTSTGVTPDGELLSYAWNCDWSNGGLFEPGIKIIDLKTKNEVLTSMSKSGYASTWQIENGIGWSDIYNDMEVTFYYLLNGERVIVDNNLVDGIIRIDPENIILMRNDGSRYSRSRQKSGINVLN